MDYPTLMTTSSIWSFLCHWYEQFGLNEWFMMSAYGISILASWTLAPIIIVTIMQRDFEILAAQRKCAWSRARRFSLNGASAHQCSLQMFLVCCCYILIMLTKFSSCSSRSSSSKKGHHKAARNYPWRRKPTNETSQPQVLVSLRICGVNNVKYRMP